MKILYDYQAFVWRRYAGIPRYFSELIAQYGDDPSVETIIPNFYTVSDDYKTLGIRHNHFDKIRDVVVRDGIVKASLKLYNKNPSKLLCTPSAQKKSVNLLKKGEYDIFHPTYNLPYFQKYLSNKPLVMTIHDLAVEIWPEFSPLDIPVRKDTEILLNSVTQIISVSENTKKDLIDYYDVDPDIINVVYLAPTFDKKWVDDILKNDVQPTHRRPYLLFVNERSGRKNFYTLVNAIRKILVERDLDLLCVGGNPFSKDELRFLQNTNVADRVIQCTVGNEELYKLYKHAVAFIFPSLNEGFGIPVLEAYACGCPVILSNSSCLPEIGGDAAVYFDPKNIKSIKEAVYKVLDDEKLRGMCVEKGYKQLSKFSWEKCAAETRRVYEKALE